MKHLQGILPIVAVPFTEDGTLDVESFQSLVAHLLQSGANGVMLFGLASEFYKLTDAECDILRSILLAQTRTHPDVTGIISITHHSWEVAVTRARQAQEDGADALTIFPPFFLGPTEEALVTHIERVLTAVTIPVLIQYSPAQTNVRISASTFARLAERYPHLAAIKVETQPPGRFITALNAASPGRLASLVGYAGVQMPDALERGAVGIQPGCSFTEIYVDLYHRFQTGDVSGMKHLHTRLLPYIGYWMQQVELIIQVEKVILARRGIIRTSYCRSPRYSLDSKEMEHIDQFLHEFQAFLHRSDTIPR